MEPLFDSKRADAADELHAGDRADVIAQNRAHLLLLALAVEYALHPGQIAVEVSLQRVFEPLPLLIGLELVPLGLVLVEVLEDLVQETATLHGDRARLLDQARVMVVPVEPRALQVVVKRGRAEVIDLDGRRVAFVAVRLEWFA